MSEWISVKDDLPKEPGEYLICYEITKIVFCHDTKNKYNSFVNIGNFLGDDWFENTYPGWNVTHWMEKPKPPEKKKKHHKCVSFDFTCEYVDYLKSLVISNKNDKIACEVLVCPFCGITKEDL